MITTIAYLVMFAVFVALLACVPSRSERCDMCMHRAVARLSHRLTGPAGDSVPTGTGQIITERSVQCCPRHIDAATNRIREAARHG